MFPEDSEALTKISTKLIRAVMSVVGVDVDCCPFCTLEAVLKEYLKCSPLGNGLDG